eukprot:g13743.t1
MLRLVVKRAVSTVGHVKFKEGCVDYLVLVPPLLGVDDRRAATYNSFFQRDGTTPEVGVSLRSLVLYLEGSPEEQKRQILGRYLDEVIASSTEHPDIMEDAVFPTAAGMTSWVRWKASVLSAVDETTEMRQQMHTKLVVAGGGGVEVADKVRRCRTIKGQKRYIVDPGKVGADFTQRAARMVETAAVVLVALQYGADIGAEYEELQILINDSNIPMQVDKGPIFPSSDDDETSGSDSMHDEFDLGPFGPDRSKGKGKAREGSSARARRAPVDRQAARKIDDFIRRQLGHDRSSSSPRQEGVGGRAFALPPSSHTSRDVVNNGVGGRAGDGQEGIGDRAEASPLSSTSFDVAPGHRIPRQGAEGAVDEEPGVVPPFLANPPRQARANSAIPARRTVPTIDVEPIDLTHQLTELEFERLPEQLGGRVVGRAREMCGICLGVMEPDEGLYYSVDENFSEVPFLPGRASTDGGSSSSNASPTPATSRPAATRASSGRRGGRRARCVGAGLRSATSDAPDGSAQAGGGATSRSGGSGGAPQPRTHPNVAPRDEDQQEVREERQRHCSETSERRRQANRDALAEAERRRNARRSSSQETRAERELHQRRAEEAWDRFAEREGEPGTGGGSTRTPPGQQGGDGRASDGVDTQADPGLDAREGVDDGGDEGSFDRGSWGQHGGPSYSQQWAGVDPASPTTAGVAAGRELEEAVVTFQRAFFALKGRNPTIGEVRRVITAFDKVYQLSPAHCFKTWYNTNVNCRQGMSYDTLMRRKREVALLSSISDSDDFNEALCRVSNVRPGGGTSAGPGSSNPNPDTASQSGHGRDHRRGNTRGRG